MNSNAKQRAYRRVAASALLAFSLIGCSEAQDNRVTVMGIVTVNKKPLAAGTIVFRPNASKGNPSKKEARATIQNDGSGRYQLTTDDRDGAAPGWYRVTVFALKPPTGENAMRPPEWLADPKYADEQTSGLEVNVVKKPTSGAYDFDLQPGLIR